MFVLLLRYKIEIVDIINKKFKTENVKVKARKLVTAFPGSYYSENKIYCSVWIDIIPKMEYTNLRKKGAIFMYITVKQAAEKWGDF